MTGCLPALTALPLPSCRCQRCLPPRPLTPPTPDHCPPTTAPAPQVKEVALMHSEGILAGEMKHGPLALVDDKLPIVVVSTMDTMHSKMAGVIQQVRCVRVLAVPCCGCKAHRAYPWSLHLPHQTDRWLAVSAAHGAQRPPDRDCQRGGRRDGGHRQRQVPHHPGRLDVSGSRGYHP